MKFRNVKVPEGINVSRHNPLGDLAILSAGAAAVFVVLAVALWYLGGALARYMPVSWENALADTVIGENVESAGDAGTAATTGAAPGAAPGVEAELQSLAGRLAAHMDLPEDMRLRVHYIDSEIVNAAAWLGGHVFVFRGLIERMPDENALAMVMGHEIAHAANRDAVANLGGALLLQLALGLVLGSAPASLEQIAVGPNALILLRFSRDAERRADADALAALAGLYDHTAGSGTLFEMLLEMASEQGGTAPELLSSHPLSENRIARLKRTAQARGWPLEGPATPLAPALAALGKASSTSP
ncbi:MAG: M48 family metallopeptidase [Proteobacteria bacterium]|nr:M48 family metallopeptidase [Pseudomonadota bacterium]